jgi:hypothetical protein
MIRGGRLSGWLGKCILPKEFKSIAGASASRYRRMRRIIAADDSIRIHRPIACADGSHEGFKTRHSGRDKAPSQLYQGHENCRQTIKRRVGRLRAHCEVVETEQGDRDKPALLVNVAQTS